MIFRLVTSGDLRLTDAAGRTVPYPEKALITICYLMSTKGAVRTRNDIAQFLWEDVEPARASANLRTLLSRVKSQQGELGAELLVATDTTVSLNASFIDSDVAALETAPVDPVLRLTAFLDHYRGQYLAGVDHFSERGRAWIEAQRASVQSRFIAAVDGVAAADIIAHNQLVKEGAFRLLQIDPHCEAAVRILMQAYSAVGQLNPARAEFERWKSRLWDDLQAAPEKATLDLLHSISAVELKARPHAGTAPDDLKPGHQSYLPRVALLPPVNTAPDSFLPGLLEDVTLGLCTFRTISVVAPHTSNRIAIDSDRAKAYDRHRISYVLDTRMSAQGGDTMLFAQLVDVRNDSTVWAERFDVRLDTLSQQYHAIARRVVGSVAAQVERHELDRLGAEQHPNAYQHYLIGQRLLKRIDLPETRAARKAFRRAINQDPHFSAALAGLARTDHMEWLLTARGDHELLKSAEQFAGHAIKTHGESSGGYRELGVAKLFQGQFDESIAAFEKAEDISPCHADLIADYADTLIHSSDPVRGLAKIEMAIELNPLAPDVYHWTAAGANYCLERYEEALACLSRMEDQSHISRVAAACWGMLGDRKKAHAYKRRTMATHPDFEIDKWLAIMPIREQWQKDQYREGLRKAGFS